MAGGGEDVARLSELAGEGPAFVAALADHLLGRLDAAAIAVWVHAADGSLELLGESGLADSAARRIAPGPGSLQQRIVGGCPGIWWPDGRPEGEDGQLPGKWPGGARAVLPLTSRSGELRGVLELCWARPLAGDRDSTWQWLTAVADGAGEALGTHHGIGSVASVLALLDQVAGPILVARPIRGARFEVADFRIGHVTAGYRDPAGRRADQISGSTLLTLYPDLFRSALAVLKGSGSLAEVPHIARFFDGVVISWRDTPEAGQMTELLDNALRIGRMGGWAEDLRTGVVYWASSAYRLFGLAEGRAISVADLHNYVAAADRNPIRQFRETLVSGKDASSATFRLVRPRDGSVRHIQVFGEPVMDSAGAVTGIRGAYQDITEMYQTRVVLAATRDQLAETEQRAIENHRLAVQLQYAIMPPDEQPAEATGIDVAVRYRPAGEGNLVGGDWYDALLLPTKQVLLVVGDVTGHGIEAVTGMVAARNALRGLAVTGKGPAELLGLLNTLVSHLGIVGTIVCGLYDTGEQVLQWARAGHLPPVLVRGDSAEPLPLPGGMLLGIDPSAEYEEVTTPLQPGDVLLLFTDGLIEERGRPITDAIAAVTSLAAPAEPTAAAQADRLIGSAVSDTGDDACLVVVRIG